MPRYDTLDHRANMSELDPCLAAEVRLKDKHAFNWKIIVAALIVLLLLIGAAVIITFFVLGSESKKVEPSSKLDAKPAVLSESLPPAVQESKQTQTFVFEPMQTSPKTEPKVLSESPTPAVQESKQTRTFVIEPVQTSPKTEPKVLSGSPTPAVQKPTRVQTFIVQPVQTLPKTEPKVLSESPTPAVQKPTQTQTFVVQPVQVSSEQRYLPTGRLEKINTFGQYFETCNNYSANGFTQSGVYRLHRPNAYDFMAQCVMEDGKAWMVMQKRSSNAVTFWNRTFDEYASGFGEPSFDHWLGLRNVRHLIDAGHKLQLRMEVEGDRCAKNQESLYFTGTWNFEIDSEQDGYRLHVSQLLAGNFTSPVANIAESNGHQFNAIRPESMSSGSCMERVHMGGWWSLEKGCPFISLNGEYSCERQNSMYGLSVYFRQAISRGKSYATSYIRPQATRMMLRICENKEDC